MNHERAEGDDENHHRDLDQNDRRVGCRAFANSVNEEDRYCGDDQHRWEIKGDGVAKEVWQNERRIVLRRFATLGELGCCGRWIRHQPKRKFYCAVTQAVEQLDEIIRPAFRDGHVADGIFKDQIPANDPGDDLAQGRIGIGVG